MKKFKIAIALLGLAMVLGGCSSLSAKAASNSEQQVKVAEGARENSINADQQSPDKNETSERQQESPDFIGEISQIVGNEITLKGVNMPDMEQFKARAEQPQQGSATESEVQGEEKKQPKAITGSTDTGFPGGAPGGGFPGGGPGGGGARGTTGRQTANGTNGVRNNGGGGLNLELEYTGEEKTFTIPVGMTITGGRGQQEITFESLQEGNVISIWLDEAENMTRVSLIGGGAR